MSFLYDKPFIVRLLEVLSALGGVILFYLAYLNAGSPAFAAVTAVLAAALILCGALLHLRKRYAWPYTMLLLTGAALYLLIAYAETADLLWILLLGTDALLIFSWATKFTRQYFSTAA